LTAGAERKIGGKKVAFSAGISAEKSPGKKAAFSAGQLARCFGLSKKI
jgi:hypothetical protein